MPELPDIEAYLHALRPRVAGRLLQRIRLATPFLVRSVSPPLEAAHGRAVREVRRVGKRIVFALDPDLFLVLHLMVAGRLHWSAAEAKIRARFGLAAFDFDSGSLTLTEAGSKRRASLHLVHGASALKLHDPGGLEVLAADCAAFEAVLRRENHTLKRTLTDPRLVSGIGNAYSDEILHRARLSPLQRTRQLEADEVRRLYDAVRTTLLDWTVRLCAEAERRFPERVTAFREGMAVHGRFRKPCPVCAAPVQRIVHAENETNYCAPCQTEGRVLADRSLSRLLGKDWPRNLDEQESRVESRRRRFGRGATRPGQPFGSAK